MLHRLDVSREGPFILIDVEGSRFLYHMVRVIAGTLMEVGKGRIQPEQTGDILRKRDRRAAGPTAAPQGLTLVSLPDVQQQWVVSVIPIASVLLVLAELLRLPEALEEARQGPLLDPEIKEALEGHGGIETRHKEAGP